MGINDKSVFPDEPPISDYPLCIIKRQIAAFLGQYGREINSMHNNTVTVCFIGGKSFMLVKKGKLSIHFVPECHISSKNMWL